MLNYLPDKDQRDKLFQFSYKEMKSLYQQFIALSDEEFLAKLPELLHFACFACYVKEIPVNDCLSDCGIVHMLAHAIHMPDTVKEELRPMRKKFEDTLKFA